MGGSDYKKWRDRQKQQENHQRRVLVHKVFRAILRKYSLWKFAAPVSAVSLADLAVIWADLGPDEEPLHHSKRWTASGAIFTCDTELALRKALANRPDLIALWHKLVEQEAFGTGPIAATLTLAETKQRSELSEIAGREFIRRGFDGPYWNGTRKGKKNDRRI